ncbi:thiamine biosynthesis lipoprotein [Chitinophaga terrae (ex Kim and Jung 2007)]|uniref:FAD:protein FMN transferase n=1 Tax=Chitinophaga terrae (ex Kim and Jung 2007) TaxID=408074 RepID=A0A1H4EZN5_9BACT|nr:FAD:protein FMN transferase [Chitinophaga terrae (ex Kim and Jung 2007)]GEP90728.1 FAD:protein FMN transferase [Chitinophaga terrae (ex Kim and Jung 2007)]SEA90108.1 thiamine biosynthesis lipoprotein [Chitinophaga terrae (ex Kim and Jung 2007)]
MNRLQEFRRGEKLMGNAFEVTVVGEDKLWAEERIDVAIDEIRRIEQLLTTFSEDSETNRINANAGVQPVQVSRETFGLIERSLRISAVTDGAFDITYGSVDKRLWNFDRNMTSLPDAETAKEMVRLINYRNVLLDGNECTVFLKEVGMRIGFGGIGKGYAAEMAKRLLLQQGVANGVVNASGDISTWGNQADGKPWTIGIADPDHAGRPFSYLNISNMAIATSGNYEKYVIIGDKKYSHTINPKTGLPVTGIKSVTIICPNAEIADAMATPVTIMGVRAGLDMVNQIDNLACIIIDDNNKVYSSQNIHLK